MCAGLDEVGGRIILFKLKFDLKVLYKTFDRIFSHTFDRKYVLSTLFSGAKVLHCLKE